MPISGRLRINDGEALSQVVLGRFGLALLPTFMIGKDIQAKRLKSVLSEYIPVHQHVLCAVSAKTQFTIENTRID